MGIERPPKFRQAGQPVHHTPKPALTLVQSTPARLPSSSEASQEIKETLRKMNQKKRRLVIETEPPEAA